jgi:lipopolysaccharide/colanic/teichoic acid biosynthesis glycosyltransferase
MSNIQKCKLSQTRDKLVWKVGHNDTSECSKLTLIRRLGIMKLIRWIARLGKSTNDSCEQAASIIQPQEPFRALIIHERQRVDRNQHMLSLLLFNVGKRNIDGVKEQNFAHILNNRIRSTDEVGWFDSKHIGVILPYTNAEGAHKLAKDICKTVTPETSIPEYTVHTYPSNWFHDKKGQKIQFKFVDLPPEKKMISSRRPSLPAVHTQERNRIFTKSPLSSNVTRGCGALPQDIDPFFPQPLPIWKRIVDVLGALSGLVVLSPLLLLVALIIKICYGDPVIFKQERVGYSGRIFTMWKFRTMMNDVENSLHQQYMSSLINGANDESSAKAMTKLDSDLPITGFGKILRATSIDELPQLINVLCGDMTLIGPRPPTIYETKNYLGWYCERLGTVPGMTGLWQVSGKNKLTFLEMIRLDIKYIRELSLWQDIMILLKTPLVIIYDVADFFSAQKKQS